MVRTLEDATLLRSLPRWLTHMASRSVVLGAAPPNNDATPPTLRTPAGCTPTLPPSDSHGATGGLAARRFSSSSITAATPSPSSAVPAPARDAPAALVQRYERLAAATSALPQGAGPTFGPSGFRHQRRVKAGGWVDV